MDRLLEILKSRKFQTRLISGIALVLLAVLVIMRGGMFLFLAMMAVSAVVPFVLFYSVRLLPLAFLFGISLPAYFCAFIYSPVIKSQLERKMGVGKGKEETDSWEEEKEEE